MRKLLPVLFLLYIRFKNLDSATTQKSNGLYRTPVVLKQLDWEKSSLMRN
jgi:hypothetical protein